MFPFPEQDPEDRRIGDALLAQVREVLEDHLDPAQVDRTGVVPGDAIEALAEMGCFGLKIPKEYGGLALSQTNYNRVIGFVSSYCASTAIWLSAHQSIGAPQPLKMFGTKEQKEKYLPRLAEGAISAFALTEVGVGSDPARMKTTATPSEDGSHFVLNGEKLWCTNGPDAEILVVMALTPPKIVGGKEKPQITAFLVESAMPGFEVVHRCSFMGLCGISNGLLRFVDMRVPAENVLGKPGEGLKIALTTLNTGRLTIPATTAAGGKAMLHFAERWLNERVQWGAPIGKHQAVARLAANLAADAFALESVNALACAMADRGGVDIRLEAAVAKYYCTETFWRMADDFLQIRGGRGFETAESLAARGEDPVPAERMLRDARILRIIEGTSEIMRLFIAREAMDTHLKVAGPLLQDRTMPFARKAALALDAAKFYARWYPKQWIPAGGASAKHLSARNQAHVRSLPKTARRMARTLFHVMARHGVKLEYEQITLQRFVDIGTDLFAMAAVLSRADGRLATSGDPALEDLTDLFCRTARARIAANLAAVHRHHDRQYGKVADALMDGKYRWVSEGAYVEFPPATRPARPTPPEGGKA